MRLKLFAAILVTLFFVNPSRAHASSITETISFTLSGFQDALGNTTPPNGTVSGSFTVTYDPSLTYTNSTTGLTVNSFSGATVDSPLGFTYTGGGFAFGGTENGVTGIQSGTNDFTLFLDLTDPSNPAFILCSDGLSCGNFSNSSDVIAAGYSTVSPATYYLASLAQSSVSASVVPEPSSIALLCTGVFGIVGSLKKRFR